MRTWVRVACLRMRRPITEMSSANAGNTAKLKSARRQLARITTPKYTKTRSTSRGAVR